MLAAPRVPVKQHAVPDGFPSSSQKKKPRMKYLQTVQGCPSNKVMISIQASRLDEVP